MSCFGRGESVLFTADTKKIMEEQTKDDQKKQNDTIKERGRLAKEFLESEFFQKFLLPYIYADKNQEYPSPTVVGWEEKYRFAFAKDQAYSELLQTIKGWWEQAKTLEDYEGKTIIDE